MKWKSVPGDEMMDTKLRVGFDVAIAQPLAAGARSDMHAPTALISDAMVTASGDAKVHTATLTTHN